MRPDRLPERDGVVSGDAEQRRSVFLNFLLNAAQAMQGQGEIRLEVEAAGLIRIDKRDLMIPDATRLAACQPA